MSGLRWLPILALLSGCTTSLPYVWVKDLPDQDQTQRIEPGDTIQVEVKNHPETSGTFVVRPNGTYLQPLVGEIPVANRTPDEVASQLPGLLTNIVQQPLVVVAIIKKHTIDVSVLGEVRGPGVKSVSAGDGLLSILARSGGLTEFASGDSIYIVRTKPKLMRVRFDYDELVGGHKKSVEFILVDGDTVVVK